MWGRVIMAKQEVKQPRLKQYYKESIAPQLMKDFEYTSPMQIPKIKKVVISIGLGEAIQNKKLLDAAVSELALISGQQPMKTKARKSIAAFKVRQGMEIGAKVTLRGSRMYEFLDRLMNIALPRVKDFKGVNPNAFDGNGNYSLGIEEQIIFPEIDYDNIERVNGMNVAIITSAESDQEAKALLEQYGMPFSK